MIAEHRHRLFILTVLTLYTLSAFPSPVLAEDATDPRRPPSVAVRDVPVVPDELATRLTQYQSVRSASFAGWSPDGKGMLVRTRFGNTDQLHRVYQPGGRREQVTFFDEPARGRFIPAADDGALLLSMSRGGDEKYQIYRFDPRGGVSTLLTDGKSRNLLGPVMRDGSRMAFTSNRRNGRDTDLCVADPRRPDSVRRVLETDREYWYADDFSRDGRQLLIGRYVSITEVYPALLDAESGDKRLIPIPGGGPASYDDAAFGHDGKTCYLTTDAKSEFRTLARVSLSDFAYTWLTEDIPWDVTELEVDHNTGRLAFAVNEDGAGAVYLLDGSRRRKLDIPLGIVSSLEFSPDGAQLGFSLARPDAPDDAYALRLDDGTLTRWTYSEVGGLAPSTFIRPERIRYRTFDGRMIPAYYFKPRSASAEKPAAVVVNIHGGPESQYRPYFSSIDQFYLNELGIAVLRPNVRGSAGYGKTYVRLDNADKREDSVKDIGALLDWIADRPELDASRVAVYGGSYGGYMVLASLVHFGDRIRAGVDIVGIASFISFLERTSPYRQDLRRAEYGDERDPTMRAFFERIDPTSHATEIRSALLVAHGVNDPRVPFFEAKQIADKVRANGRSVWTVYADNEGHGFRKKDNRDYLTAVTAMFLEQHLRP
jgi:dipeptidyl aminopeptidase/acylaminoacyl peptidase